MRMTICIYILKILKKVTFNKKNKKINREKHQKPIKPPSEIVTLKVTLFDFMIFLSQLGKKIKL